MEVTTTIEGTAYLHLPYVLHILNYPTFIATLKSRLLYHIFSQLEKMKCIESRNLLYIHAHRQQMECESRQCGLRFYANSPLRPDLKPDFLQLKFISLKNSEFFTDRCTPRNLYFSPCRWFLLL